MNRMTRVPSFAFAAVALAAMAQGPVVSQALALRDSLRSARAPENKRPWPNAARLGAACNQAFGCGHGCGWQGKTDYVGDVKFAVDAIEKECKTLLASKKIDWKKVTAPLVVDAKKTKTDEAHLLLLARLQDGHAEVRPLEAKNVKLDLPDRSFGPGLFLCRVQQAVFVKNAWGPAAGAGVAPGMEVVTIDGQAAEAWLQHRTAELADLKSFSTPQQA